MRGTAIAAALGVVAVLGVQGIAGGSEAETQAQNKTGEAPSAYSARADETGPVKSKVHKLALTSKGRGEATLSRRTTEPFGMLGVSWPDPDAEIEGTIEARARDSETGKWSDWIELEPYLPGLDGERPAERGSTEPVWVGHSDGAEVRVSDGAASGKLPSGLRLDMVDPIAEDGAKQAGDDLNAEPAAFAAAAAEPGPPSTVPQPPVVTRAEWGADESLNDEGPIYLENGVIKAAFVHHTATGEYSCTESAAIVRSLHVYHVKTNGWRDLGYNFLVDKCGTIFEGRQGGIDQPVQGAHTYGFNSESTGVSVIGDYTDVGASDAAQTSVARMAAYKLGQYGGDPAGKTMLVAGATQTNYHGQRFTAGQSYEFDQISGHRDGFNTQCPGMKLYPQLPTIRTLAAGPVQNLKVTSVGGGAVAVGSGYESPGPVTVNWSTTTPSSLISRFELLVDGATAATVEGNARKATATLTPGTHRVSVKAVHQSGKATSVTAATVTVPHPKSYFPVTPKRLMDTRIGLGVPKAPVGDGGVVTLDVAGVQGIPATGVGAVVLNVTATQPTAPHSYVSVYPDGTERTSASSLNFVQGQTKPNLVIVPLVNGKVNFYNRDGTVHLIADVTGYYMSGAAAADGATHFPVTPQRLMDTRSGLGVPKAPVGDGGVVTLQVAGVQDVPADVSAVVLNVTATQPTAPHSYVAVYPDGTERTSASSLNFVQGQTTPNLVIVPVVNGKVNFYNWDGTVHLIADVTGYFRAGGEGASHYNLTPKRLMDTRSGLGVPKAPVGDGGVVTLQVSGVQGVPASGVTAVVLNVTATQPTAPHSYAAVYPDGTARTSASSLNYVQGETVPNLVIVPVVNGKINFYNWDGTVHLIADITGYFSK
ncbi:peptidoglycan recognition protein [Streptomyces peucetius]|uniref:Peptidoglycan recognition protein n=1 Tax=Streptomyces peucetius TaxID=1950 RepID=A0ABY6IA37_STRPE|nr:peptidoglycan recognition protein [Streptomyces peucetius]UYQ63818.1 peptidoglycan recognition protein [Streptomyces peucetius]